MRYREATLDDAPLLAELNHQLIRDEGHRNSAIGILRDEMWPRDKRLLVEVLWHNMGAVRFWKAVGFEEYSLASEILPEVNKRL